MTEEGNTKNQAEVIPEPAPISAPAPAPVPDSVSTPDLNSASSQSSEIQVSPEVKTETVQPIPSNSSRMKELWLKFREKVVVNKNKKLERIIALALKKSQITNDDVQELLRVSDATATRYLQELVRQGRLKRSGTTSGITYEPTP